MTRFCSSRWGWVGWTGDLSLGASVVSTLLVLILAVGPAVGEVLSFEEAVDGTGPIDMLYPYRVECSPDGEHVYVAAWDEGSLTVFAHDPLSRNLVFVQSFSDGVGGVDGLSVPMDVAASPDLVHVYVASSRDDAVAVFRRVPQVGGPDLLEYRGMVQDGVGGVEHLAGASSVEVFPDGTRVAVTSQDDDSLLIFSRTADDDELVLLDVQNQSTGTPPMSQAVNVAVAPGGLHLYVAAYEADSLLTFAVDPGGGGVTWIGVAQDGVNGVDGLNGASDVVVSADGLNVYASGYLDSAVAMFGRDLVTGELDYLGEVRDGVGGVAGINGALDLAELQSRETLLVAGVDGQSLAVFARDGGTGLLAFDQVFFDGVAGVAGLSTPTSVAANQALNQVYVTGWSANALARFAVEHYLFADGFEDGTTSAWSLTFPGLLAQGLQLGGQQ